MSRLVATVGLVLGAVLTVVGAATIAWETGVSADPDRTAAAAATATPVPRIGFRDAPQVQTRAGQSFVVDVMVYDVTDLFGWQVDLTCNKEFLRFDGADKGPFLGEDGTGTYYAPPVTYATATTTWVRRAAETRLAVDMGATGTGAIARVSWTALKPAPAGTTLSIAARKLVDRNAQDLAVSYASSGNLKVVIGAWGVDLPYVRR